MDTIIKALITRFYENQYSKLDYSFCKVWTIFNYLRKVLIIKIL